MGDLRYKPDIFTIIGIYRNNVWGFRPSIYISQETWREKESKIVVTGTGKWYINSSNGLEIPENESLDKIVADVWTPTSERPCYYIKGVRGFFRRDCNLSHDEKYKNYDIQEPES